MTESSHHQRCGPHHFLHCHHQLFWHHAIVQKAKDGKWLNANYYDDTALFLAVKDYMIETLKKHITMGLDTQKVFVLGKKNATFLHKLNKEASLFGEMVVLEHPRYIEQYKSKEKQLYIDKFITEFSE